MDFVWFILIGIAAGWLAGQIMRRGSSGILGDLIVGVIGALIGGFLFSLLGLTSTGLGLRQQARVNPRIGTGDEQR